MTKTSETESFAPVAVDQLSAVTGGAGFDFGSLISQIGGAFGPEGSKWAGVANGVFGALKSSGVFGGAGGGGAGG